MFNSMNDENITLADAQNYNKQIRTELRAINNVMSSYFYWLFENVNEPSEEIQAYLTEKLLEIGIDVENSKGLYVKDIEITLEKETYSYADYTMIKEYLEKILKCITIFLDNFETDMDLTLNLYYKYLTENTLDILNSIK